MDKDKLVENGCNCRLCSYDREFAEHLARIPESEHSFFEELKDRWEHADFDAQWYQNGEVPPEAALRSHAQPKL